MKELSEMRDSFCLQSEKGKKVDETTESVSE